MHLDTPFSCKFILLIMIMHLSFRFKSDYEKWILKVDSPVNVAPINLFVLKFRCESKIPFQDIMIKPEIVNTVSFLLSSKVYFGVTNQL